MKKYSTLVFILLCIGSYGQNVGINTTEPKAQLDVDGNVIIRTVDGAAPADTYDYLVVNPTTKEIEKVNGNFNRNLSIAKAAVNSNLTLLGPLFGGFENVDFTSGTVSINPGGYFNVLDGFYTVPSNGVYEIFYYFKYGTGIQATVLTDTPKIGILLTPAGSTVAGLLDEKPFSGANLVVLVNITISSSEINSVYKLNAGDKISFGYYQGGLLNVSLLGSSKAEFLIKKISD